MPPPTTRALPPPLPPPPPLKSTQPRWQRVAAVYRAYGLRPELDLKVLPSGVVYRGGRVALDDDHDNFAGVGMHDLAHWMVAPDWRRYAANFGLGPHPAAYEKRLCPLLVGEEHAQQEEEVVCNLNVLLAAHYLGGEVSDATADFLNTPRLVVDRDPKANDEETFRTYGKKILTRVRTRVTARGYFRQGKFHFIQLPEGTPE